MKSRSETVVELYVRKDSKETHPALNRMLLVFTPALQAFGAH